MAAIVRFNLSNPLITEYFYVAAPYKYYKVCPAIVTYPPPGGCCLSGHRGEDTFFLPWPRASILL